MAKIKDYEPFPKGLGALAYERKATRKQSARGRKATKNDILSGALPFLIAAGAVAYFVKKNKPASTTTNAAAEPALKTG